MISRALEAIRYFTVLPLGRGSEQAPPGTELFAYLAPIGAIVGGLAGSTALGAGTFAPHAIAVAVAFGLSIALTGALHVDGFLDACDALFASVAPAKRLEILEDPHHGTFAIASFAVVCVFWLAALSALPLERFPIVLAYAAAAGRWSAVLNAPFHAYRGASTPRAAIIIEGLLLVALSFAAGPHAWIALPILALFSLTGGWWAARRLGGVLTGDVYGGLAVAAEVLALGICSVRG